MGLFSSCPAQTLNQPWSGDCPRLPDRQARLRCLPVVIVQAGFTCSQDLGGWTGPCFAHLLPVLLSSPNSLFLVSGRLKLN